MIPPEAVDAAHEQLEAMGAYVSRDYVEATLEAAAPHMLAEFEKRRKYEALDAISELGSDEPGEPLTKRTPDAR